MNTYRIVLASIRPCDVESRESLYHIDIKAPSAQDAWFIAERNDHWFRPVWIETLPSRLTKNITTTPGTPIASEQFHWANDTLNW